MGWTSGAPTMLLWKPGCDAHTYVNYVNPCGRVYCGSKAGRNPTKNAWINYQYCGPWRNKTWWSGKSNLLERNAPPTSDDVDLWWAFSKRKGMSTGSLSHFIRVIRGVHLQLHGRFWRCQYKAPDASYSVPQVQIVSDFERLQVDSDTFFVWATFTTTGLSNFIFDEPSSLKGSFFDPELVWLSVPCRLWSNIMSNYQQQWFI